MRLWKVVDDIVSGRRPLPKRVDMEQAIEGVACTYIGDRDVKEIVLYTRCIFDPLNANRTAVPVMLVAISGLGKTKFLEGLRLSMEADVVGANDLTGAGLGMVDHQGQVVAANLSDILAVDEIEKTDTEKIHEVLLPVFEAEPKERVRYATKFRRKTNLLTIGAILKDLAGMTTKGPMGRRRRAIEQLFRRCVLLRLAADQPEDQVEYTRMVLDQARALYAPHELLPPVAKIRLRAFGKVLVRGEVCKHLMRQLGYQLEFEDENWNFEYLQRICPHFHLGEEIEWGRKMQRNITLLAAGRALSRGELLVKKADFEHVGAILVDHAQQLGYWQAQTQL